MYSLNSLPRQRPHSMPRNKVLPSDYYLLRINSILNRRIKSTESRKESGKNSGKCFKFVWLSLCLIGVIYHLYDTTSDFLKYPTGSQVTITNQKEFLPPAMSVCFNYYEIIIPESLSPEARKIWHKEQCYIFRSYKYLPQCTQILGNITYSEMLKNKTVNIADIMMNFPGIYAPAREFTEYFRLGQKCVKLALFKDKRKLLSLSDMDDLSGDSPVILQAYFNVAFRTFPKLHSRIGIHNSHTLFRLRKGSSFEVTAEDKGDNYFRVDSQLIESRYLKYPFESNCADYDGKEYESRSECFELCYGGREGRSNDQHGFITTDNYDLLKYEMFYGKNEKDKNLENECYKKCRTDCTTTRYHGSLMSKFALEGFDGLFGISLFSSYPSIRVVMIPSFGLTSFIIFAASVTSLWFGCSIFVTVRDVSRCCCRFNRH